MLEVGITNYQPQNPKLKIQSSKLKTQNSKLNTHNPILPARTTVRSDGDTHNSIL